MIISSGWDSTPTAVPKDCSDKVDDQLSLNDDHEQLQSEFITKSAPAEAELPVGGATDQEQPGVLSLNDDHVQPQTRFPRESDRAEAELPAGGGANQEQPRVPQNRSCEGGEKVAPTNINQPPRRSARAGAGQHSSPYHLPRPVFREGVAAAAVTDPQILNSLAQSNLLIAQLLATNAQT